MQFQPRYLKRVEFLIEYLLQKYYKIKDQNILIEVLSLVELALLIYRLKNLNYHQIYDQKEEEIKEISYDDYQKQKQNSNMSISQNMNLIKKRQEYLRSSNSQNFKEKIRSFYNLHSMQYQNINNDQLKILFSEVLYIVRPLTYCLSMRVFGVNSYKPWFVSLAIDIIR